MILGISKCLIKLFFSLSYIYFHFFRYVSFSFSLLGASITSLHLHTIIHRRADSLFISHTQTRTHSLPIDSGNTSAHTHTNTYYVHKLTHITCPSKHKHTRTLRSQVNTNTHITFTNKRTHTQIHTQTHARTRTHTRTQYAHTPTRTFADIHRTPISSGRRMSLF